MIGWLKKLLAKLDRRLLDTTKLLHDLDTPESREAIAELTGKRPPK